MAVENSAKGTFIVQVLNNKNATWQGTVNWIDERRTQPFRSTLELLKLIDSALEEAASADREAGSISRGAH
jgi:hypothetical protein